MPIGPAEMPDRYVSMYDPASLPMRGNVFRDGAMAYDAKWFKVYRVWDYFWRVWGAGWHAEPEYGYPEAVGELPSDALPEGFDLRDLTALYYGATTCVDDLVGRLVDALAANGLAENTILLFTSDHGDNLGSHHLFNKDCLYEESIRIPFIVRYPAGIAPAENGAQIAQLVDVMPTLLDLCGLEVPGSVQGQSLAPVLRGEGEALPGNAAYIETPPFHFGRPCVGVRTPTHLYGAYLSAERGEMAELWGFYDLRDDPLQERNLIETGAQAECACELHAQLAAWHEGTPWLVVDDP
jgi:choline-sulfatase